jgi:hypothetical protein
MEATIQCPKCMSEIPLSASLAAPLIEATRRKYEREMADKDAVIAQREASVRSKEKEVLESKRMMEERISEQVAAQVTAERARLALEESRKARNASAAELDARQREINDLKEVVAARGEKLAEAQAAQANVVKRQRELEDQKRELDLTVETRIREGLADVRLSARREAEEGLKQKVLEKDQTIVSMQRTIEELKNKADQGSQQLQGEVQELALEGSLRSRFPFDLIEPVPKGEFGGDIVHRVRTQGGILSGTILWEVKRTRNWSDSWLAKLREDQREAKAEVCVLVSAALPKHIETFDVVEGVWVIHPRCALPVATILRDMILQVTSARQTLEGQQTKTEMVYQYLTGPRFRQRVEAIVEAFSSMQEDLDKERKVMMKQWAKREEQIERVMGGTVGMYGDLQGIAGKSLLEIEGLELRSLEYNNDLELE